MWMLGSSIGEPFTVGNWSSHQEPYACPFCHKVSVGLRSLWWQQLISHMMTGAPSNDS